MSSECCAHHSGRESIDGKLSWDRSAPIRFMLMSSQLGRYKRGSTVLLNPAPRPGKLNARNIIQFTRQGGRGFFRGYLILGNRLDKGAIWFL